jgi:uncharacterized protein involved in exopolysaccharide biosynthesis/Mrp family chromosome partitioning ATPase
MQNHDRQSQAPGLGLADIYYILFRRKWLIIGLSTAGLLGAAVVYFRTPAVYSSEAKLFIRYVSESRLPSGTGGDSQVKTAYPGGGNIINTEIEIMKSLDLAKYVAAAIGPEKFLGTSGVDTNVDAAAGSLKKGLTIQVPPGTDILRVVFQHSNREIVQPVLVKFIEEYKNMHLEMHRPGEAAYEALGNQIAGLSNHLFETEGLLRTNEAKAGLMSIDNDKKAYTEEISKIQEGLLNTQAELAERQAALQERQRLMPAPVEVSTNQPDIAVPPAKIKEYRSVSGRLESLRKKEQEALSEFTEENPRVLSIRELIASAEKVQKDLEAEYPKLTKLQLPSFQPGTPVRDWSDEAAQIVALQAKYKVLTNQLENLNTNVRIVNELEPAITELQREKEIEEAKYRHISISLEQASFDKKLTADQTANINVAQKPTPPSPEKRQLVKTLATVVGAGVFGGIALAFVLELFLDPTVRRPVEIETRLRLPLFLTIPYTRRNRHLKLPEGSPAKNIQPAAGKPAEAPNELAPNSTSSGGEVVRWPASNGLRSYYEALRDRLVTFFEIRNLTHKPKLIAVTGCAKGAGVTTIATGLATSLSETGDGNVLLVDMSRGQGAAVHPLFKGKSSCGLADALEGEKREDAMVHENLYMAAEGGNGDKLSRILPRRFNSLMPKLKASDYDYIIFDMPPINQISITPRLAGFMDLVLLVIESEKTDREAVKRATSMLAESKANVSAILNKNHNYVPKRLSQDL